MGPRLASRGEDRTENHHSQFFLFAWHGMPSFGCDTDRFSLWEWYRLRGEQVSRLTRFLIPHIRGRETAHASLGGPRTA